MSYPVITVSGPSSYSFPEGIRVATVAASGADQAVTTIQGLQSATVGLAGSAVVALKAALTTLEGEFRNLASEHREMVACLEEVLAAWSVFASSYGQAIATYNTGIRVAGAAHYSNLLRPTDLPYCEGQTGPPYSPVPASGRLTYKVNLNGSAVGKFTVDPDPNVQRRQRSAEQRCRKSLATAIAGANDTWKAEVKAAARRMSDLEGRVASRLVGSGGPGSYDFSNAASVVLSADSYALWAKTTGGHKDGWEDSPEAEVGLSKNLDAMDDETMRMIQSSPQAMEAFALAWPQGSVPQPLDSPEQSLFRNQLAAAGLNSDNRQSFYNSVKVDLQNRSNSPSTGADLIWVSTVTYSGYDLILLDEDPNAVTAFQNGLAQIARVPAMSEWLRGFGVHLGEQIGAKVEAQAPSAPGEESPLAGYLRRFLAGGSITEFTDVPFYPELVAYLRLMSMAQSNLDKQFSVPVKDAIADIYNLGEEWATGIVVDGVVDGGLKTIGEKVPGLDLIVGPFLDLKVSSEDAEDRLAKAEEQWADEAFLKQQLNLAIGTVPTGVVNWVEGIPDVGLGDAGLVSIIVLNFVGITTDIWSR